MPFCISASADRSAPGPFYNSVGSGCLVYQVGSANLASRTHGLKTNCVEVTSALMLVQWVYPYKNSGLGNVDVVNWYQKGYTLPNHEKFGHYLCYENYGPNVLGTYDRGKRLARQL